MALRLVSTIFIFSVTKVSARMLSDSLAGSQMKDQVTSQGSQSMFSVDAGNPSNIHIGQSVVKITQDQSYTARARSQDLLPIGSKIQATVQCPSGDTNGLSTGFYTSSMEGSGNQDEIDFEFLGNQRNSVQTNYYVNGLGHHEAVIDMGFDCSEPGHVFSIYHGIDSIQWSIDNKVVRKVLNSFDTPFPSKQQYAYLTLWDASSVNGGAWTGKCTWASAPFISLFSNSYVTYTGSTPSAPSQPQISASPPPPSSQPQMSEASPPPPSQPQTSGSLPPPPSQSQTSGSPPSPPSQSQGAVSTASIVFDAGAPQSVQIDSSAAIEIKLDQNGTGRARTQNLVPLGKTVSSAMQCPAGDTSGLVIAFYFSSQEGSRDQDEIDFEILGDQKDSIQTNYWLSGVGHHESIIQLGFDCSEPGHRFAIYYGSDAIKWYIDGNLVRTVTNSGGVPFPSKEQYVYWSMWDASSYTPWAGVASYSNSPYTATFKDNVIVDGDSVPQV